MNKLGVGALATGALALAGQQSFGVTTELFRVDPGPAGTNAFVQQSGNAAYEYGEFVHLPGPDTEDLVQICIDFGFFTYDPATYTPSLQLDLFNAPGGVATGPAFATAYNSSVVFTGSNYNGGGSTRNTEQSVCFDFTNITLPSDFIFAYRDNNPAGYVSPGFGFSVFLSSLPADPGDPGTTTPGIEQIVGPGGGSATVFVPFNMQSTISSTVVPEPATAGLLAIGGAALAMRRRKA